MSDLPNGYKLVSVAVEREQSFRWYVAVPEDWDDKKIENECLTQTEWDDCGFDYTHESARVINVDTPRNLWDGCVLSEGEYSIYRAPARLPHRDDWTVAGERKFATNGHVLILDGCEPIEAQGWLADFDDPVGTLASILPAERAANVVGEVDGADERKTVYLRDDDGLVGVDNKYTDLMARGYDARQPDSTIEPIALWDGDRVVAIVMPMRLS